MIITLFRLHTTANYAYSLNTTGVALSRTYSEQMVQLRKQSRRPYSEKIVQLREHSCRGASWGLGASFLLDGVNSLLNEIRKEALKHLSSAFTEFSHNRLKTSGIQPGFSCSAHTSSLYFSGISAN